MAPFQALRPRTPASTQKDASTPVSLTVSTNICFCGTSYIFDSVLFIIFAIYVVTLTNLLLDIIIMCSVYLQIFNILSRSNLDNEGVLSAISLLDDYTCNFIHDIILDNLFDYLSYKDKKYLLAAKGMCIQQIFQILFNESEE